MVASLASWTKCVCFSFALLLAATAWADEVSCPGCPSQGRQCGKCAESGSCDNDHPCANSSADLGDFLNGCSVAAEDLDAPCAARCQSACCDKAGSCKSNACKQCAKHNAAARPCGDCVAEEADGGPTEGFVGFEYRITRALCPGQSAADESGPCASAKCRSCQTGTHCETCQLRCSEQDCGTGTCRRHACQVKCQECKKCPCGDHCRMECRRAKSDCACGVKCACNGCPAKCFDSVAKKCGNDSCDLKPGEPAQQILDLMNQIDPDRNYFIRCPGLNTSNEECTASDEMKERRAEVIKVVRAMNRQERENAECSPEDCGTDSSSELDSQRFVDCSQAAALRASASVLEHTAAQLEEAELCDEADHVRHLADQLRGQARSASAAVGRTAVMPAGAISY